MTKPKGRPRKITAARLKEAGYQWKPDNLTKEEADEWEHGKKMIVNGKPARGERPDFFYHYKEVAEGVEVRIFTVGDQFFWSIANVRLMNQLPIIEAKEIENAKWNKKIASIPDTKPPKQTINKIVDETPSKWPEVIELEGGPLNGQKRPYSSKFPLFMEQVVEGSKVSALRYKRDKDNLHIYKFDQTF